MVRRNSIEASTRSSMAKSDSIHGAELTADPIIAKMKMFENQLMNLSHAQTDSSLKMTSMEARLDAKVDSLEEKMDANFNELQQTLSQISNQLGISPIESETSRQTSPVTFSDAYVRDDHNRLPLDTRKSLLRKIELPKFDGSDAYDWLSKVERIFRVDRYSDSDKLDLVALSLERDVLKWFNWQLIRREFRSWEDFRRRLFRKFGAAPAESPGNRLFAIKQTGTVSTSVTELEELSAQVIEQQTVYKEDSITQLQSEELSSQVVGLDASQLEQLFDNELQPEMNEVLKLKESIELENHKPAVLRMEPSSFCQLFSEETRKLWENQQSFTSKPVASVHFLSFEVGTEETMPSGLSPHRQVWEPGGVLADHVLVNWLMNFQLQESVRGCDVFLVQPTCPPANANLMELLVHNKASDNVNHVEGTGTYFVTSLHVRCGWMVFDRGKNGQIHWAAIQTISVYKGMSADHVTHAVHLDVKQGTSFKKLKFGKNWWYKFKDSIWQRVCDRELFQAPPLCSLQEQREVTAGAICQTYRFSPLSPAVVMDRLSKATHFGRLHYRSYHVFKLEDKLVFGAGSIVTIKQSYCRRKKEESESSNAREVSSANRGFALTEDSNSREASDAIGGFAVLLR